MSRKVRQVPIRLDSRGTTQLSPADLAAILRASDPLIMSAARTLLSKILKGSRDRKIIDLKLDACPAFGHFGHLDHLEILARIDWAILNGYLTLEYSGRLPPYHTRHRDGKSKGILILPSCSNFLKASLLANALQMTLPF